MNPQIKAARAIHDFLFGRLKLDYAINGGPALQVWHEPRFSKGLGITVRDKLDPPEPGRRTRRAFGSRVADPRLFAANSACFSGVSGKWMWTSPWRTGAKRIPSSPEWG